MKTKRWRIVPFLVGFAVAACAVVGLALAAFLLRVPNRPPDVVVRSPLYGAQVSLQQGVPVTAIARDREGVTRVELWVDGELLAAGTSQLPGGSTPFPITELWRPSGLGTHTLTVRAFDRSQNAGQATVIVEAIDAPKAAAPEAVEVQEGDSLGDIAARHGLTEDELAEANPGATGPLSPGDPLHLPPPPADTEGPTATEVPAAPLPGVPAPEPLEVWRPSLVDLVLRPFTRIPRGQAIGVEAFSLVVDKPYDGVYCYFSLDGAPFERIPVEGYLENRGDTGWGIDDWAAGERVRVLRLAADADAFATAANCLGYRATSYGGDLFDLGTVTAVHPKETWDGREIEQTGTGAGGWFRVVYRIHPLPAPEGPEATPPAGEGTPEPPYMPQPILSKRCDRRWLAPAVSVIESGRVLPPTWFVTCELAIDYAGGASGFLLLRDGAVIRDMPTGRWEVVPTLSGWQPYGPLATVIELDGTARPIWPDTGDLPPPGESYEFQVIAYVGDPLRDPPGGWRSPPSNIVEIGSDIWAEGRNVRVTFYEFDTGCLHGDEGGFETWGWGARPVDEEGHPIVGDCGGDDLDEWATAYGGVTVNGSSAFRFDHYIHSARRYPFERNFFFYNPSVELYLGPSDSLTIRMRLWDGDLASDDEAFCHGEVAYSPPDLEAIEDGPGARLVLGQPFASYYGDCYLTYNITILP